MTSAPTPTPSAGPAATGRPIATFDLAVLDTPEPQLLADFYCALLGWEIVDVDDDWIAIRGGSGAGIAFQLAPDFVSPAWPDNRIPQQGHLDLNVPDLDVAEEQVLAIGARSTGEPQQASSFRVYLDPSGHPFCLCLQPG